jgi:hypothetical protein
MNLVQETAHAFVNLLSIESRKAGDPLAIALAKDEAPADRQVGDI